MSEARCERCGKSPAKPMRDYDGRPRVLCRKHRKRERYRINVAGRDFRRLDKS